MGGSRSQTLLRSTLSFQVSPILTADHQLLPLAFSFHYYLRGEPVLIDEGGDADNGRPQPSNGPLPSLSQDGPLSGQITRGGDCRTENGKKKASKWGTLCFFWADIQMFSFSIGLFGMRTALTKPPSDWFLPSTTFVHNKCLP